MSYDRAADLIRKHEGFRDHVYMDTEGVPTCGYGHALIEGSYVPPYICERFFAQDFRNAVSDYDQFGFDIDFVRKAVVINMLFNLGVNRFKTFRKLINALHHQDYLIAAYEMIDSKWAKQVGPNRSGELANMMLTGEWPDGV